MTECSFCSKKATYCNPNDFTFCCDDCMDKKDCPWINIKDKFPERLEQVLVYSERGIEIGYLLQNLDVFMINHTIRSDKNCVNITHWMPLPDAPHD